MSQSQAVRAFKNHNADLKSLDLLYAVLLHALVLIIIAVMAFWQQQHKTEPLKRIEVMMISAKDLAKLEQQAQPKIKKRVVKPRTKIKKPKPKTKKKIKSVKPTFKTKVKAANKTIIKTPTVEIDDDFDPFAPIVSSSNRTAPIKKASTSRPELANLAGKQLSNSEKERYIALMQAAVQKHWKISASASDFNNPLVEMKLLPTGAIASVRILESSGNAAIDSSLIRAIHAAGPFDLPRQQFEFFRVNRIRFHPLQ